MPADATAGAPGRPQCSSAVCAGGAAVSGRAVRRVWPPLAAATAPRPGRLGCFHTCRRARALSHTVVTLRTGRCRASTHRQPVTQGWRLLPAGAVPGRTGNQSHRGDASYWPVASKSAQAPSHTEVTLCFGRCRARRTSAESRGGDTLFRPVPWRHALATSHAAVTLGTGPSRAGTHRRPVTRW